MNTTINHPSTPLDLDSWKEATKLLTSRLERSCRRYDETKNAGGTVAAVARVIRAEAPHFGAIRDEAELITPPPIAADAHRELVAILATYADASQQLTDAVNADDYDASYAALHAFVAAVKVANQHAIAMQDELKRMTIRLLKIPAAVFQA